MNHRNDLPAEARIAVPLQRIDRAPAITRRPGTEFEGITAQRALLMLATLAIGLLTAVEVKRALAADGLTMFDAALATLFFALLAWIAFGFLNSFAGFIVLMFGRNVMRRPKDGIPPLPKGRTAVLMPIYNEELGPLAARWQAMLRSVEKEGATGCFDFFILSDSRAENEAAEHAAFEALRSETSVPLYYRRRPVNTARKPGNIFDWVERFGAGYEYMIVLDADSLMSAKAMSELALAMDRHPGVGLLQTIPTVIRGRTVFARWQQFVARLYGPIASAGLIWWSNSESSFWGHNAIVRVEAFAESCRLPELPGKAPFGGHIMSHDMVEAALLRRRGWAVHMVTLDGSYEEFPPTLVDYIARDRRWCQGNMQHVRLLDSAGFHWINRLQLIVGISAYVTAPLWLILLVASVVQWTFPEATGAAYGPPAWLLGVTVVLLFGPKLLAVIWAMADPARRADYGGTANILRSVAVDIPLSIVVAPMMMLSHTINVIDILAGRSSGWNPQRRDVDGIALSDATRKYTSHIAVGLIALALLDWNAGIWMLPVIAGLLLTPFIVSATSRSDFGGRLASHRVFRTAEDERFADLGRDDLFEKAPLPRPADPLSVEIATGVRPA